MFNQQLLDKQVYNNTFLQLNDCMNNFLESTVFLFLRVLLQRVLLHL